MDNQLENTFEIFFLGVMVGLYGNWLISFFDKLTIFHFFTGIVISLLHLGQLTMFPHYLISHVRLKI
jgi:hypothetical protein